MVNTVEIEQSNKRVREGFDPFVTETTGLGRVSQEHAYLGQLVDYIPTYPTRLSLVEVGIGSNPVFAYRSALTPWFLWGFLNSRVCHPQLTVVEQNPHYIDQLNESAVFVNKNAIDSSQDHKRAWNAMQHYLNQPSFDINMGGCGYNKRPQTISGIATPAGFADYPWVQVINADAATLDFETPLLADIVFARNVAYQMSAEAQKLFLQNVRQNYMGKPGSFLVITDCKKQGDYQQTVFKENKGWLGPDELHTMGYALKQKHLIGGTEPTWSDYILQSV